jgi:RNA polymerase sigma-70 factor (ECF subfamily)
MMKTTFAAVADDRLILSVRGPLIRRAVSLVGPADAEDVVHDAFERALRARSVRSDGDPRPWLHRIARNVAYDTLRLRARQPAPSALANEESAERTVLRREIAAELDGALQLLSPAQRRAIVLHDLEGYSNAEIASLEGIPYHTARTRLFRARRAMRDKLVPVAA